MRRNDRLRILRVIARMNVGGPALQVVAMTEGLDPKRFETRLLSGMVEPGEEDYLSLRAPDLPITRIPLPGRRVRPTHDLRALQHVIAEIKNFRPHIVHTHTAKAGVLGRVAARLTGVPITVHTFHGHLLEGYFSRPVTKAIVFTECRLARWTTRLVAVGASVRDDLLAAGIGHPSQYTVVPPGVEPRERPEPAEARRSLGLPAGDVVVGFAGRFTDIKRPERFVEVARRLVSRWPEVTFALLGGGRLEDELRSGAAPLGTRVRFLGWRSDVETFYAACDLVVLTSDNEGMPVTLIEAAHQGVPVVTTDVGSAGEVVMDGVTGYVTPVSVEGLARAVELLIADPELRVAMGGAAEERARKEFSRSRLIEDMQRLYEELASNVDTRGYRHPSEHRRHLGGHQ